MGLNHSRHTCPSASAICHVTDRRSSNVCANGDPRCPPATKRVRMGRQRLSEFITVDMRTFIRPLIVNINLDSASASPQAGSGDGRPRFGRRRYGRLCRRQRWRSSASPSTSCAWTWVYSLSLAMSAVLFTLLSVLLTSSTSMSLSKLFWSLI